MQYRIDPKTGNKLSILGFGCMRFPSSLGRTDVEATEALLQKSIDAGVNYFDAAYLYAGSETILGNFLEKTNQRDKVYIATKLPLVLCKKPHDFDRFLNTQLERLKTDHIDYYLMHMLTNPALWQKLCDMGIEEWITKKQAEGTIRQIGFSYHGQRDDFPTLVDAFDWDFCQIQYNYVNVNYQAGIDGLKYAYAKGLPVVIMEPLLGGKLATSLPEKSLDLLKQSDPDLSPVGWAFNWLWNQPEPTVLLSGMNALDQLEENLVLADMAQVDMLSEDDLKTIEGVVDAFNESFKIPCTGCNYCMPCPKNVDIPACFAAYNSSYSMGRFSGFQQYITGMSTFTKDPSFASNCIGCKKCETHCPQNIPISTAIKDVEKRLEPFWMKAGLSLARRIVR